MDKAGEFMRRLNEGGVGELIRGIAKLVKGIIDVITWLDRLEGRAAAIRDFKLLDLFTGRPNFAMPGGTAANGGFAYSAPNVTQYHFHSVVPYTAEQARRVVEMTSAGVGQQPHRT